MYAITGITGNVGGALANTLLAAGRPVRAIMRDEAKASPWAAKGCEIAIAEMTDAAALTSAFRGAEAAFILPPPEFDPQPGYPEAGQVIGAVAAALTAARPKRVLCLSTIGADAPHDNLLSQRTLMETALRGLDLPVTFLRPAWFMENAAWDVVSAREEGVLHSFLQPADKGFPMVATEDVGRLAAELIQQDWTGERIVELEGPTLVSPNDLARAFAETLGTPVRVEVVPRQIWEAMFRAQGMQHPMPRIRMLDGFNEGWISFGTDASKRVRGMVALAEVIRKLVGEEADQSG